MIRLSVESGRATNIGIGGMAVTKVGGTMIESSGDVRGIQASTRACTMMFKSLWRNQVKILHPEAREDEGRGECTIAGLLARSCSRIEEIRGMAGYEIEVPRLFVTTTEIKT
jgi:hypothetical protein